MKVLKGFLGLLLLLATSVTLSSCDNLIAKTITVEKEVSIEETFYSEGFGELAINFSAPIINLSDYDTMIDEIQKKVKITISPNIKGRFRPIGTQDVAFEFTERPMISTRYTVTLNAKNIRSIDDKPVDVRINYQKIVGGEYQFTTTLIGVSSCYAYSQHLDTPLYLNFTVPVDINKVREYLKIEKSLGGNIDYRIEHAVFTNSRESNDVEVLTLSKNHRTFMIYPKGLEKNSTYKLSIRRGLPAKEGTLGLNSPYNYSFDTYKPLFFKDLYSSDYDYNKSQYRYYPESTIMFSFNNPLDNRVNLTNLIKVTPSVENLQFSFGDSSVYVNGNFKGNQTYTIEIKKGLKDVFGQTYNEDISESVTFEHSLSYMGMPNGYMVMESKLPPILPFKVRNVGVVNMEYYDMSTIVEIAEYLKGDKTSLFTRKKSVKQINIDWEWDKYYNYRLDLSKFKKKSSGLFAYRFVPKLENKQYKDSQITIGGTILFTDIGVTVKSSPSKTYVFVRRLSDNKPIEGATVYNLSQKTESIGKTDKAGILQFAGGYPTPFIAVEHQNEIGLNYGESSYYYDDYYYDDKTYANVVHNGNSYYHDKPKVMLFTERYIYKPSESVEIKGIVRNRRNDEWRLGKDLESTKITVTVENSRGEIITNIAVQPDDFGSLQFTVKLAENSPTGYYYVRQNYTYDTCGFRVEDYKPVTAEIKVITKQDVYKWGDTLDTDLIAWYLFGAPVIKPIQYNVEVYPASYYSTKYPEYSFSSMWWYDDDSYSERDYSFTLLNGTGFPDKDGKINITKKIEKQSFKGDAQINISGTTVLDDKSTVYGSKGGINLYNPVHFGIKVGSYFVDAGKNQEIKLIALDEKENVIQNQTAMLEIQKREWKSFQKVGVGGNLRWEWEMVKTNVYKEKVSIGQKSVNVSLKEGGYYVARLRSFTRGHENISEDSFYVISAGEVSWKMDNSYEIELETDKKNYDVGDTAKILVKNPFKECRALITIEREKFYELREITIKDNMAIIPVSIKEEYIPNVYVSVMLFSGRSGTNNVVNDEDLSRPSYRIGYANLSVEPKEKKLALEVKTDKERYEPGDKAKVWVNVKDYKNQNIDSEVTLTIVDKGVLNLVNYQLPNPLNTFYETRPLAVYTSDMREFIYGQRYLSEKGEVIGGDGMEADEAKSAKNGNEGMGRIVPRANFKTTAFYNAKVITKGGQSAQFEFTVPDNLTSFKVMAVGQTKDSRFGYGESLFTVSKPIMLLSSLPRFLRLGDTIEAGATVYNYTGKSGNAKIQITVEEPCELLSPATVDVKIENNASKEVRFKFKVKNSEKREAKFTIKAKLDEFGDGYEETLPIRMPKIYETTALYEKTENKAAEKITISDNVIPEMSKIRVNLSPTAFTELKGCVDYLVEYPYGCLEQKCSSILPLILGEDVIVKLGLLKDKTKQDVRKMVQTVLDELPKYVGKKSFVYWIGENYEPNPYLTVYATFILTMAKNNGYQVDNSMFKKALDWTKVYADGRGEYHDYTSDYYRSLVRNFALYTASLNNYENVDSVRAAYSELKEKLKENMPAHAYLLKTVAKYKDFSMKEDIIDYITKSFFDRVAVEAQTVYFKSYNDWGWFYYNNVISTALVLQAVIESGVEFDDTHKVIRWLIRSRLSDGWSTTHENAIVFWAFNTYLNKYEASEPNFKASVRFDKEEVLSAMFKTRNDKIASKDYNLKAGFKGDINVSLEKQGQGILYYHILYQYILKKYPPKRDAGFNIEKSYFDYDSKKAVTNNQFVRGKRYIVKITVFTPKDRNFAVLDDQLPSGFEPVNLDFATEGNENRVEEGATGYYWWGTFNHTEKYRDRVIFTARYLRSGSHTLQYVVRANALGSYSVPQVKAEEMYAPEVFGHCYQPDVTVVE